VANNLWSKWLGFGVDALCESGETAEQEMAEFRPLNYVQPMLRGILLDKPAVERGDLLRSIP